MEDNIDFNETSQGSTTTEGSLPSGNSNRNNDWFFNRGRNSDRILKQNDDGDIDKFSQFMFGNSKSSKTKTEEVNDSQKLITNHESLDTKLNHDLFSNDAERNEISPNPVGDIMSNKNVIELMATIDTLIETVNIYKPIINDISPLVKQVVNKFKAKEGSKKAK